ncbi:MAG: DUF4430 domain-containing protein [Patescibacteria group bacterium]|nr:DUF4430 domain-containing protein [Patescibacteria group bacterium]MCL5095743.1 DUF4430 domain-containing protein [Patescibacteria group bacterium]
MRKYLLLLISLGILGGLGTLVILEKRPSPTPAPQVKVEQPKLQTQIVIENEETRKEATVSAKTALEALQNLAKQENLDLKTKQYDFGVFVEGIGGVENTKEKAWIYFINGKSAEVAADKYELKNGDIIEWKYIKPNF